MLELFYFANKLSCEGYGILRLQRHVVRRKSEVSEEYFASIFRVESKLSKNQAEVRCRLNE